VRRAALAISGVVPVSLLMLVYVPGILLASAPARSVQGQFDAILAFGAHCLFLNPLFQIAFWDAGRVGLGAIIVFGFFKATAITAGFSAAKKSQAQLACFGTLVLLDLLSCIMLGVGRYDSGIEATVSSRYQYVSLVCLAPFLGAVMERGVLTIRPDRLEKLAAAGLLAAWCALLTYRWPDEIKAWSAWRGTEVRSALEAPVRAPQERFARATLDAARAAQLKVKYHLH
jgi:hypothetical protein